MKSSKTEKEKARTALKYIIPILEKYKFKWCISGGFACYLHGVDRPIKAIDIDIEIPKDNPKFIGFINEVREFTELPFQLWIDKNYDNWVTDVVIDSQYLSICDTPDLKLFNKKTGKYEVFYKSGIPKPVIIEFEGLQLPIAPKESVLKMKLALAHKKPIDRVDIKGMKELVS